MKYVAWTLFEALLKSNQMYFFISLRVHMFVIVWRITIYGACQITKSERGIIKKKGPMDHEVFYCQRKEVKLKKGGNYVLQNTRMKERGIIIPINSLKEVKTSPNYIWTYVWNRVLLLYTSIYMSITKFLGILKDIKVL